MRKTIDKLKHRINLWIIKTFAAKQVVAVKLEKLQINLDSDITSVSISFYTLPNRLFASVGVHYQNGGITQLNYDDLELAQAEFNYAYMLYLNAQKSRLGQTA